MGQTNESIPKVRSHKQRIGQAGEDYAAKFLSEAGLIIIKRNYRCPKGEIDIIAQDQQDLVFVEVRTRSSAVNGWGEESISRTKRQHLIAVASYYVMEQHFKEWPKLRFDLVALRWQAEKPLCNWLKAIF
ncbi:MAG: YraN family protein [Desulfitobacteriaceae bacterium]